MSIRVNGHAQKAIVGVGNDILSLCGLDNADYADLNEAANMRRGIK